MILLAVILSALNAIGPFTRGGAEDDEEPRILIAHRANWSIHVDAVLNELDWQEAPVATGFLQYEPNEGARPSQKTGVRVLYGNSSVYVSAYLHDTEANQIWQTLGRRDSFNRADWFFVSIDSYLNRKSAYTFGVNAAGVQMDGVTTRELNSSWDAVWESAVRVVSDGWIVEMRIPYSMLRFSEADIQTWGLNFVRVIPRTGETLQWALIPRTERQSGVVAKYGELQGLESLRPRRNIQITPYSVSQVMTEEGDPGRRVSERDFDFGADLKLGLSSNIILDATFNPDFGQVDADPAELNLSAFETFFRERRPFFVEGAQTLDFALDHGSSLLYTRRIGAGDPIIGASKVTGRTDSGLSFGMLGAATGNDFDPSRLFGVARIRQELGKYSRIGGILTMFDNAATGGGRSAYVGGADWDIRFADNSYKIDGFVSVTDRRFEDVDLADTRGLAASIAFDRIKGDWTYSSTVLAFDDKFNPNDLGRLRRGDFYRWSNSLSYQFKGGRPIGPFRRASFRLWNFQSWRYRDGLNQGMGGNLSFNLFTNGYQKIDFSVFGDNLFGGYDAYETRGLLPYADPRSVNIRASFDTDSRRQWQLKPSIRANLSEDGGRNINLKVDTKWDAGSRLSLSGSVALTNGDDERAWASNESYRLVDGVWEIGTESYSPSRLIDDQYQAITAAGGLSSILDPVDPYGDSGSYYVSMFGRRDTRTVDFTLRSNVTFTPRLSIQLYGQLFVARGRYGDFAVLQDRDSLVDFDGYPKNHDFAFNTFQTNTVLRWEYSPGSTLFLVWTHSRKGRTDIDRLDSTAISPYNTGTFDQITDAFGVFPQNVFLIKLNYLFLQ